MALTFKKAVKAQSKLRLSIAGPSGSGKTYTSLKVATEMGGKIAVIDTERGSASKYSDIFDFDVIELEDFHPDTYIEAIRLAEKSGYDILVIDSTTHEWNGKNGILELHEATVQKQRTKNSYTAWAEVTPLHNAFINAILQSKCHVIASVRSKTEYVQEKNEKGYTEVKKIGMASVQRADMDYEYDVMMEMNIDHVGTITKTRCAALDGKQFRKPGAELAEILTRWLSDGTPQVEKPADPDAQARADAHTKERGDIFHAMQTIYEASGQTDWSDYAAKKKLYDLDNETLKVKWLAPWQKKAIEKQQAADPLAKLRDESDELMGKLEAAGLDADSIMKLMKGVIVAEESDEKKLTAVIVRLKSALNELAEANTQKALGF